MGEPLIVEVTDHRGQVRFRAHLDRTRPATMVGRAPRNDVILDDPYADAEHLRITPVDGGGWRFTDLDSTNGVWFGQSGIRCPAGTITAGLELKAGRSILRFVSPDAPVAAALSDPAQRSGIGRRLLEPRTIVAILATGMVFSATTQYYASTDPVDLAGLATPGLTILILAALWASAWAFTNRLVAHRFRFLGHWAWAVLMTTVGSALTYGRDWLGFFAPNGGTNGVEFVTWWLVGGLLLVGHFELVTEWPRVRRWTVAMIATGVLAAIGVVLQSSAAPGRGGSPRRSGALKPIAVRYLPATSLDRFVRDAGKLKQKVDELETESESESGVTRSRSDSSTATATHLRTSGRGRG